MPLWHEETTFHSRNTVGTMIWVGGRSAQNLVANCVASTSCLKNVFSGVPVVCVCTHVLACSLTYFVFMNVCLLYRCNAIKVCCTLGDDTNIEHVQLFQFNFSHHRIQPCMPCLSKSNTVCSRPSLFSFTSMINSGNYEECIFFIHLLCCGLLDNIKLIVFFLN
jgi:hypothetical protein